MKHIFNPPLDRKGSSYHDMLFLCERFYLEECYALLTAIALWAYIEFLPRPDLRLKSYKLIQMSGTVPSTIYSHRYILLQW